MIRNLCCILVTHLKKQGKVNLKSNITGKNHNDFSVMKELVRGHDWLQKNDPNVENKHHLSLMRPTTVHFLTYAVGQLMWSMDVVNGLWSTQRTIQPKRLRLRSI